MEEKEVIDVPGRGGDGDNSEPGLLGPGGAVGGKGFDGAHEDEKDVPGRAVEIEVLGLLEIGGPGGPGAPGRLGAGGGGEECVEREV